MVEIELGVEEGSSGYPVVSEVRNRLIEKYPDYKCYYPGHPDSKVIVTRGDYPSGYKVVIDSACCLPFRLRLQNHFVRQSKYNVATVGYNEDEQLNIYIRVNDRLSLLGYDLNKEYLISLVIRKLNSNFTMVEFNSEETKNILPEEANQIVRILEQELNS